jgi:hypothetical protein
MTNKARNGKTGAAAKRRTPAANIDDDMPYVRNENGELVPYCDTQCVYTESGLYPRLVGQKNCGPSPKAKP